VLTRPDASQLILFFANGYLKTQNFTLILKYTQKVICQNFDIQ
jgi:hypothetical protein